MRKSDPPAGRRLRLLWLIVRTPLVCLLLLLLLIMIFEKRLIFFPYKYPAGDWTPVGLAYEDAFFDSADGTRLHGWYVPHDNPKAVVLFSHGNAGNLSHRAETLRDLHDLAGVSVMIHDYRGYGRSKGRPDQRGVLADARAGRAWLASREGIPEDEIVQMGRSLGGAVAVDLAARDGARALVLESTFTSIPEMARTHYPWLPFRALIRNRFDALAQIADFHGPLLHSHGDADSIVPYQMGCQLFQAANQPKQFITLRDRDHNDPQPPEYYQQLATFLDQLPPSNAP